ncbi:MAG: UDP-N-acetylglucosamine 2-epimerase, partial [Candidatus Omnitrophica bacterium]|nr:UDP-N-acetylglucosamine 2-epimerase [Candidatus Omnitrophota bacterium]
MKITTIIGARPQFIKAKMISLAIKKCSIGANGIKEVLINTGQHYDYNMAGQFFDGFLDFQPEYNLGIGSHSREKQIFVMVRKIKEVFQIEKPDVVIVYGDTNSTLAGARAANSLKIKVAHIEAGLRSYDMNMPEEVNRLETDKLSHYLFC